MEGDIKEEKKRTQEPQGTPNGQIRDNLSIKINNDSNELEPTE